MKKLELYKSASDFAFASLAQTDPAALDIAAAEAFQAAKYDSRDYQYWRQSVTSLRNTFGQLANQLAPSAQQDANKPKTAAPAAPIPTPASS